ncbi:MAG: tryptophan synthase alpha chain [bacterium]|nr:MAG: tryptophan synthase alpha chain [bacterium]
MTTARIDARFASLKAEGRAGFVAYVMAGDPTRDEALQILRGLPAAGADLIELGFPFSDPMAEGPPIRGVDGLIVVDCPPEEAGPLSDALDAAQVSLIRLATPTSDDARLKIIAERTSGFVYYVSVAGVTGVKEAQALSVAPAVERVRKASGLPVAVGFGVKTPERAASIARVADAVVAGSVLVDEVAAALEANEPAAPRVLAKVKALADAVRGARVAETV